MTAKNNIFAGKIWAGMTMGAWYRALKEGHFSIAPCCFHWALMITIASAGNTILATLERLFFQRKISSTEVSNPPIFVVGHPRTGTTLLHELLSLDSRLTYPTTFECFCPSHFLITESILSRIINSIIPKHRPMDAMAMGAERPQEDEFALCNLGVKSIYLGMIFPKYLREKSAYQNVELLSNEEQEKWKQALFWFLKKITYRGKGLRIVIKTPSHSFRMRFLHNMFPDARFVLIKRDPYIVYKSTVKLWMALLNHQGLQKVKEEDIKAFVIENYVKLQKAVERDKKFIPEDKIHEISYEELVANPMKCLETIYARLDLDDFAPARPAVTNYLEKNKSYQVNKYELLPSEIREINDAWGKWIVKQGYPLRSLQQQYT